MLYSELFPAQTGSLLLVPFAATFRPWERASTFPSLFHRLSFPTASSVFLFLFSHLSFTSKMVFSKPSLLFKWPISFWLWRSATIALIFHFEFLPNWLLFCAQSMIFLNFSNLSILIALHFTSFTPPPGGGGRGTPLHRPYRYVPPKRVGLLRRFGLKTGMEASMVFEETAGVYERIYRFNFKWIWKRNMRIRSEF